MYTLTSAHDVTHLTSVRLYLVLLGAGNVEKKVGRVGNSLALLAWRYECPKNT